MLTETNGKHGKDPAVVLGQHAQNVWRKMSVDHVNILEYI